MPPLRFPPCLQYLASADVVVVMSGGRIKEVGGYEELLARGVDLHSVAKGGGEGEGEGAASGSSKDGAKKADGSSGKDGVGPAGSGPSVSGGSKPAFVVSGSFSGWSGLQPPGGRGASMSARSFRAQGPALIALEEEGESEEEGEGGGAGGRKGRRAGRGEDYEYVEEEDLLEDGEEEEFGPPAARGGRGAKVRMPSAIGKLNFDTAYASGGSVSAKGLPVGRSQSMGQALLKRQASIRQLEPVRAALKRTMTLKEQDGKITKVGRILFLFSLGERG